ncbi:olfactory receptor 1496-like [Conger conger]|uniref:olfactory receptor 1496-like n=1 Tax=Conger conger TaxID=82655 RepID=UPI002A599BB5|nr:olfactory receptor 1496-like [Conger conger]
MVRNNTHVTFLILTAYDDLGKMKYFYFSLLLFLYLTIIFANTTVISLIFLDSSLHEPMYLFLCNLFVNELFGSTAFFPVVLFLVLSDTHEISRIYCSLQVLCLYSYGTTEIYNLAFMSYDRYLSICHPLHYSSRMNPCKVYALILFTWFFSLIKCAVVVALQLRLPLCGNIIHKLYCTNYGLVKYSCIDATINNIYGVFSSTLNMSCAQEAEMEQSVGQNPSSEDEVTGVIGALLSDREPGVDEIHLEMLKDLDVMKYHFTLEWFRAECDEVGISISKSVAIVIYQEKMACPVQVKGEQLPQVEEFKYLRVLFTSEGKRDWDMQLLYAVVVLDGGGKEGAVLYQEAKFLIYQ